MHHLCSTTRHCVPDSWTCTLNGKNHPQCIVVLSWLHLPTTDLQEPLDRVVLVHPLHVENTYSVPATILPIGVVGPQDNDEVSNLLEMR
eukprot:435343-Prorocentrum_lima.AAC.1